MSDFFDRLLVERDQLNSRLNGLNSFMETSNFLKLDSTQRNHLINQQYHMSEYLKILDERIKDLKIKGSNL